MRSSRLLSVGMLAGLVACNGNGFNGIAPRLGIGSETPRQASGEYLVDFGTVAPGQTGQRTVTVLDVGRAPLEVAPLEVPAPFVVDVTESRTVPPAGRFTLTLSFTPNAREHSEQTVVLHSNGGEAKLILRGDGGDPPIPPACVFVVAPLQKDFGVALPGQKLVSAVQFANLGEVDCTVSNIQIDPTSDPVFALAPGQPTSGVATTTGGSFPLTMVFLSTEENHSYTGTLSFDVEPSGPTIQVPLSAHTTDRPCLYQVSDTELDFFSGTIGQPMTKTLQISATSDKECEISGVALANNTAPSFHLDPAQPLTGMATLGSPFSIQVTFLPTEVTDAMGGVLFTISPPVTPLEVPLRGTVEPCRYHFDPPQLNFGAVDPGRTATKSATFVPEGTGQCEISNLHMDPAGSPYFALDSMQPVSGTGMFTITVTFAPTATGPLSSSDAVFDVSPPAATGQLHVNGIGAHCQQPFSDGSCPVATAPIYLDTWTELFSYDPVANRTTTIGTFDNGVAGVVDIGIDIGGNLLAIDFQGGPVLYSVNPQTASCQRLGSIQDPGAVGLSFLADGSLVVAGDSVEVLDPTTLVVTKTIVPAGQYTTSGDIVGLPDGMLYWTVSSGGGDHLIRVNPATGATTDLGALPANGVFGLAYTDGKLYGFDAGGETLVIDPMTAQATIVRTPGYWSGATTNPLTWDH